MESLKTKTERCLRCGKPSTGYFTNLKQWKYYCTKHWYAKQAVLDKWLDAQYEKQYGGQDWFEVARPKPKKKVIQGKLF